MFMAQQPHQNKNDDEDEEKKLKDTGDSNDDDNNGDTGKEFERIYWTTLNQLKLQCEQGCDGVLDNCHNATLAQTIYQIEGLPKKMECRGPDCDTILEKRKLCFHCSIGVIKVTGHVGMAWCRFTTISISFK